MSLDLQEREVKEGMADMKEETKSSQPAPSSPQLYEENNCAISAMSLAPCDQSCNVLAFHL